MIEDKNDIAKMIAYLMRETLNKYANIELTDDKYDELIADMNRLLEKFSEDKTDCEGDPFCSPECALEYHDAKKLEQENGEHLPSGEVEK